MATLLPRSRKTMTAPSSSIKRWVAAAITIMVFLNLQHNASLMRTYGRLPAALDQFEPPRRPSTTPRPLPTLTLIDPHFLGGFRNQHMRFVALVSHAKRRNLSQILLPSLSWGDAYNKGASLGHEHLFDVDYWNARAAEKELPRLVRYDERVLEPGGGCFNVTSRLWRGLDEAHLRHNETNLRKIDTNVEIRRTDLPHCRGETSSQVSNATTYLVPIGAGKGSGKFWNDYYRMQNENRGNTPLIEERLEIEQSIFQLLRPSIALRRAMDSAIQSATTNDQTRHSNSFKWMALHPRVEQEMMSHRCHVFHEQNLTRVFERIGQYPAFTTINNGTKHFNYNLIFIAVSTSQVEKPPRTDPIVAHLTNIMIGNNHTLVNARHHGVLGVPIFESGANTAKQVRFQITSNTQSSREFAPESFGVTELTASIINFFTAVTAPTFIGVRGSSFSTDVFAVRHYLNKDEGVLHGGNFIIGPEGIEELIGPPKVHNC